METAGKRKRRRSFYTEVDANGFIYRKVDGPSQSEQPTIDRTSENSDTSFTVSCSEGTDDNSCSKTLHHEKAAMVKMFTESIMSNQPQLQETEVHDKLLQVIQAVFANSDVIEVLSLPNRPTLSSDLSDKMEERKKQIQRYEQELTEWDEGVEEVVQQCDQKSKSQEASQSDDSIEKAVAITVLADDVSLLDDSLVNMMNVDHVRQQLETLHSTVEEGLKQMSNVQDDVMKKMEQDVEQLTMAHQLPLPTQTPRTTIVQLKQIPNINDTFYHS